MSIKSRLKKIMDDKLEALAKEEAARRVLEHIFNDPELKNEMHLEWFNSIYKEVPFTVCKDGKEATVYIVVRKDANQD